MIGNSYASHLEHRLICPDYQSTYRSQGRFTFKSIHQSREAWQYAIGGEMIATRRGERWRRREIDPNAWIFRCYYDGTALYRQNMLQGMVNRPCWRAIEDVINKHYYKVRDVNEGQWNEYYIILRRKPLCPTFDVHEATMNLGEFLLQKYNVTGGDNATI